MQLIYFSSRSTFQSMQEQEFSADHPNYLTILRALKGSASIENRPVSMSPSEVPPSPRIARRLQSPNSIQSDTRPSMPLGTLNKSPRLSLERTAVCPGPGAYNTSHLFDIGRTKNKFFLSSKSTGRQPPNLPKHPPTPQQTIFDKRKSPQSPRRPPTPSFKPAVSNTPSQSSRSSRVHTRLKPSDSARITNPLPRIVSQF